MHFTAGRGPKEKRGLHPSAHWTGSHYLTARAAQDPTPAAGNFQDKLYRLYLPPWTVSSPSVAGSPPLQRLFYITRELWAYWLMSREGCGLRCVGEECGFYVNECGFSVWAGGTKHTNAQRSPARSEHAIHPAPLPHGTGIP